MDTPLTGKRDIIIVGGGVIGATTAYFLSRHPSFNRSIHRITILEATSLASAASGKAGGLLALWAYPSCIVPLSYRLHAELASKHNGEERWGYRTINCASVQASGKSLSLNYSSKSSSSTKELKEWEKLPKFSSEGKKKKKKLAKGVPKDLDWIDQDTIENYSEMGTPQTTAQVHPYLFTTSMVNLATEAGVQVIFGRVTKINSNLESVRSVTYEEKVSKTVHDLEATDVIIAAGPWTPSLIPQVPIEAVRAHSVIIEGQVSPYAIFTEISLPKDLKDRRHGPLVTPELYPRPDGTVYACGEADSLVPLPLSSDLVTCDESKCQDIVDYVSSISTVLKEGIIREKQACYLPSVKSNICSGPLIGKTKLKGLFLATGHTCWGIQNSCATGKLMSEIIFDGRAKSASIDSLDPRHFV